MEAIGTLMANLKSCSIVLLVTVLVAVRMSAAADESAGTSFDVVTPKTGHELFGTFQGTTDSGISFTLDSGSQITLSWDRIDELKLNHKVTLESRKAKLSSDKQTSIELDHATIRPHEKNLVIVSDQGESTVAIANIASISNPSSSVKSDKARWVGSIAPKASLSIGTQGQQMIGGALDIRRTLHPDASSWQHQFTELQLDANNTLATQVGSSSIRSDEYDGKLNHAVYLADRVYAHALASGYHNSSLNLYLEQNYGGGLGGRVLQSETQHLELIGDLLFIGEHFLGNAASVGFAGADLTESYTIVLAHLKGGNFTLGETGSYLPAFNQQKAWQARGNASLSIPLTKALSWNFQYRDDYMENAPSVKKNWSTTSVGITYTIPSSSK